MSCLFPLNSHADMRRLEGVQLNGVRVFWHAKHLLELISSFPTTNPSPSDNPAGPPQPGIDSATSSTSPDLPTLLSQIRARYRLLCSSLGVRPRLVASKDGTAAAGASEQNGTEGGVVERIEGRMKGVDTKKLLF